MPSSNILVTGGAGFIGSHLVDRLIADGKNVIVYDNLSSGKKEFIEHHMDSDAFSFVEGDLLNVDALNEVMENVDEVWHLAANPDVRVGATDTHVHVEQNVIATHNVLETMKAHKVPLIVFTSTSTVYGEASVIPTPEDYGPMIPISLYGASKLAAEALISAYCNLFDMESVIYRFANTVGSRSTHGVIFDFVNKLRSNPDELEIPPKQSFASPSRTKVLEILGDGQQRKSYFLIDDCIDGMIFGVENRTEKVEIYNLGSEDMITVTELADIVVEEMGLQNVNFNYTGGVDGGRGWKGDVKTMQLSIDKLKSRGWTLKNSSEEAIRKTVRNLIGEMDV